MAQEKEKMAGRDAPKNSRYSLQDLICTETLQRSFRSHSDASIELREELKALLTTNIAQKPNLSQAPRITEPVHIIASEQKLGLERCLDILVEDFCKRKTEILKLNKARKESIHSSIQNRLLHTAKFSLEQILQAKIGSKEHDAFLLFSHETALFHIFQILLLKRWADLKLLPMEVLQNNSQTLNWKITCFLKKNCPKKLLQRNEWLFLKLNIYSWYSPSAEAWERIRLHLLPLNLENTDQIFLSELLLSLSNNKRLQDIGIHAPSPFTNFSWNLVLQYQKQRNNAALCSMSPVLLAGLNNGQALLSFQKHSERKNLQRVHGFTCNELEHFLTELMILWINPLESSHPALFPLQFLDKISGQHSQDFTQLPSPTLQSLCSLAFFDDNQNSSPQKSLTRALNCLSLLEESGLFLYSATNFWITEESSDASAFREEVLKQSALKVILDLRQWNITDAQSKVAPKGIFVFEKCSSKETRDYNRPVVIRLRGQSHSMQELENIADLLVEKLYNAVLPGEILTLQHAQLSPLQLKVEVMAAATTQFHLKGSPWTSLTENSYYEISSELKKTTSRIYSCGNILKTKNLENGVEALSNFKRALPIVEVPGKALTTEIKDKKNIQYIFIPDRAVAESNLYFSAMINSSSIQFWYRQEREFDQLKKGRGADRQTEQLLKLLPVVRIFADSTILNTAIDQEQETTLSTATAAALAEKLLAKRGQWLMKERMDIHRLIEYLEVTAQRHLEISKDFMSHLYPELKMERWSIPSTLPEISAAHGIQLLKHLDQLPITHHPAIQFVYLRATHDFRLSQATINTTYGPMSEMLLYNNSEPTLRLHGPTLLIRALHTDLQNKLGKSWIEIAKKSFLPADAALVNSQIQEYIKITQQELSATKDASDLLNSIFAVLFGIAKSIDDSDKLLTLKKHTQPEDLRILPSIKPKETKPIFRTEDFVSPRGLLQQ